MLRTTLIVLAFILVAIQFLRPEKNQTAGPFPNDITTKYAVPAQVHAVLKRSCFDCHSNNTDYPWYNNIQPVAWFLDHHVQEAKGELNFNEFTSYSPKKARHKLEEVSESVTEGWMPLDSYLWIHRDAKLSPAEVKLVADWANGLQSEIPAPADTKDVH